MIPIYPIFRDLLPETKTLLAAMTVPPPAGRMQIIDRLILDLMWGNVWRKMDVFWVFAAHTSQAALLNWKNPGTLTATVTNAPTFTVDQGYNGNGTTSYVNTGWNANAALGNYTQNDAHHAVYCRTNRTATNNAVLYGTSGGSNFEATMSPLRTGGSLVSLNKDSTTLFAATTTTQGFWIAVRTSSAGVTLYQNTATTGTTTDVSVALTASPMLLGAYWDFGSPANPLLFSSDQFSCFSGGGSLDASQRGAYQMAIEKYMKAIGAGVLT